MKNEYDQSLYQHEVLLYAIDFYTQSFEINEIVNYTFEFCNEILTLHSSALFTYRDNKFVVEKSKNFEYDDYKIEPTEKLNNLPIYHGQIVYSNYERFFSDEDIRILNPELIIPLFIKDKLQGFILTSGKVIDEFNKRDYLIAHTMMRLANMSLENTNNIIDLKEKNKDLDTKVYNLFFVNQTTRSLLSELEINTLYTLCTDVIGEVSCSNITSFALYDETRDRMIIRNYRDIGTYEKYYGEFELYKREYKKGKVILNYNEDIDIIKEYFVNWQDFKEMDTEYIILLVQTDIIGFVTIGKPVNGKEYEKNMFELIESLVSTIYLAINNAKQFKIIKDQKKLLERKFNILQKLNSLIKKVNSSSNIEDLLEITAKILGIGFNIEKFFIAISSDDTNNSFNIIEKYGLETDINCFKINNHWDEIVEEGTLSIYESTEYSKYFNANLLDDIGESNCLVISPLKIESTFQKEILGFITVLKTENSLSEEEVLLIDTIASSISPLIKQLKEVIRIEEEYILNPEKELINQLNELLYNKREYHIDFSIYYKEINKKPLEKVDLSQYGEFNYIYLENYLFAFAEEGIADDIDCNLFDGNFVINSLNDFVEQVKLI